MPIFAHTKGEDPADWQLLIDHLSQTAELAGGFQNRMERHHPTKSPINLAYVAGLLHDIGKYSQEFQARLRGDSSRVDHSTAGADLASKTYGSSDGGSVIIGKILSYIITGHHGGLLDYDGAGSGLKYRLHKSSRGDIPDYSAYHSDFENISLPDVSDFKLKRKHSEGFEGFMISFYIRMLYSCVVDADRLDTEHFSDISKHSLRYALSPQWKRCAMHI